MSFSSVVVTVSDAVAAGTREDGSGDVAEQILDSNGLAVVGRVVVPDERDQIERALLGAASEARLVVTTGGTGLGPRDVTPEATRAVIEREAPGIAELMRASGVTHTPLAALARGVAGTRGSALIINLPGSPRAVRESLEAILVLLPHALQTLGGDTDHG